MNIGRQFNPAMGPRLVSNRNASYIRMRVRFTRIAQLEEKRAVLNRRIKTLDIRVVKEDTDKSP